MDFNEHTATRAVQDSFRKTPDPRLQEILTALTRHLHAFVRETRPSVEEWEQARREAWATWPLDRSSTPTS